MDHRAKENPPLETSMLSEKPVSRGIGSIAVRDSAVCREQKAIQRTGKILLKRLQSFPQL